MSNMLRNLYLFAAAAAAVAGAPASAQSTTQATASASIKKPLILSRKADLSFGDILLSGSGSFTGDVTIQRDGTRICPSTYFTCSGTPSAAVYNASGNKSSQVRISVPSTMTLTGPNGTLTMAVDAPTSLTLTNSGFPGTDFGIGGTLTLSDTTQDGAYSGTLAVTAEYQ